MRPESLGLIGVDAVAASVGWSAVRAGVPRVTLYADDRRAAVRAAKLGAVTEIAHEPATAVRNADLVVIAGAPMRAAAVLEAIGPAARKENVFVTDLASPKRATHVTAARLDLSELFAGSSPVVVPRRDDVEGADPRLLRGQIVYVTPGVSGGRAAAEVADFWSRVVGAHPVTVDAERHDTIVAWTAHLPHAAAFALAAALAEAGPDGITHRASTLDQTRVAAGDDVALADALLANRTYVLEAITTLGDRVNALREALQRGDGPAVQRLLERGREWRRRFDR